MSDSEICVAEGELNKESRTLTVSCQEEGENGVCFYLALQDPNKKAKPPVILTIFHDLSENKSSISGISALDPYTSSVLICAAKKVGIEAVKCIAAGSNDVSKLIDCMKDKGMSISIKIALCFLTAGLD